VGFGGIGEVVPGGTQAFRINHFLPGGGGGARFQLSKTYRVNLPADVARGKDTWTWSIGVGEALTLVTESNPRRESLAPIVEHQPCYEIIASQMADNSSTFSLPPLPGSFAVYLVLPSR
jgi:hypothetical protein